MLHYRLLGLSLVALAMGCCTTECFQAPWRPSVPQVGDVAEVGAVWADGLEVKADGSKNGALTLGFIGRVYLFGADHANPRMASGTLSVHLYDDAQQAVQPPVPREVWNFDQANLNLVFKKDGLGWGYNLWLPWTTALSEVNKISLIVYYQPSHGPRLSSMPAVITVKEEGKGRVAASVGNAGKPIVKNAPTQVTSFTVPKSSALSK